MIAKKTVVAASVPYDNASSGLTAIEVQAALDEIAGNSFVLDIKLSDSIVATDVNVIDFSNVFSVTELPSGEANIGINFANLASGLDHGLMIASSLDDDDHAAVYINRLGKSGGQSLFGGTDAGDDLNLAGSNNSNPGTVIIDKKSTTGLIALLIKDQSNQTMANNGTVAIEHNDSQGDPSLEFLITGVQRYIMGINNLESGDPFVIRDRTASQDFLSFKSSMLTLGHVVGDVLCGETGQSSIFDFRPATSGKYSVGTSSFVFDEVHANSGNFIAGGVRGFYVSAAFSEPPLDSEIDAEVGLPASLGNGWSGTIRSTTGSNRVYHILVANSVWYHAPTEYTLAA